MNSKKKYLGKQNSFQVELPTIPKPTGSLFQLLQFHTVLPNLSFYNNYCKLLQNPDI